LTLLLKFAFTVFLHTAVPGVSQSPWHVPKGRRCDPFTITDAHGRCDRPSDALVLNRNAQLRDFLTRGFSTTLQEQLGTSGNFLNQKTARPDISRPRSVGESPFVSRQ